MMHVASPAPATHPGLADRGLAAARAWWRRWRDRSERRAAIGDLDRISDHLLRDIGLHRGDITVGVRRERPC